MQLAVFHPLIIFQSFEVFIMKLVQLFVPKISQIPARILLASGKAHALFRILRTDWKTFKNYSIRLLWFKRPPSAIGLPICN